MALKRCTSGNTTIDVMWLLDAKNWRSVNFLSQIIPKNRKYQKSFTSALAPFIMTTRMQQMFPLKRNSALIISSDKTKNYFLDDIKSVIKAKINHRQIKLRVNN